MTSWKTKAILIDWKPPGSRKLSLCQICRSLQMQTQVLERPKCRRWTPNNRALLSTVQINHWQPFAYFMSTLPVLHKYIISTLWVHCQYIVSTSWVIHQHCISTSPSTSTVLYHYFISMSSVLHQYFMSTLWALHQYFISSISILHQYCINTFFTWTHACALEHCGREKWFEEPLKNTVGPWSWFGSKGISEGRQD